MATAESVKTQLTALLNQANDTTGKTDETLTAAIASLAAGFWQGGSGGDSASVQYASGTYVLAQDSTSMSININDIGFVPDFVLVKLDETDFTYDTTPTKKWVLLYIPNLLDEIGVNPGIAFSRTNVGVLWRGGQGTNTQQVATVSTNYVGYKNATDPTVKINLFQSSSVYPVIAGTYQWYACKIWVDE